MPPKADVVLSDRIERFIFLIRGHKVMIDSDLAELYGVETRVLTQAVKRNLSRFPADFMFQLSEQEAKDLRSQAVISKRLRGGAVVFAVCFYGARSGDAL